MNNGKNLDSGSSFEEQITLTEGSLRGGMHLNNDGAKLFRYYQGYIYQYQLSAPYVLSNGVTLEGSLYFQDLVPITNLQDIIFSPDGSML
ncbi:hypothetical protein FNH22_27895 [Fulvivirga sp. M361]|uniref:hypothetical protein n=1 Tax=Fulvivirga sp. M361 TaxID=2594266 RepID=UPI00117A103A|nr:hypothetical protein [Fulvivirga sp. M361]TRX49059.1 hypothetical protein FNH22_27895 [Fulvivirga sp. M361]